MFKKPARDFGNILEDMLPWCKKEHDEEGAMCHQRSLQGSGSSEGEGRTKKGSRKEKKKLEITELEDV